jgi:perosamine synthetase
MKPILELAQARGLKVLEDAAEAHLSSYQGRPAGALGEAGIFSFTPSKAMTTGEGGMVTTASEEIAGRCRRFIDFGDVGKFQWSSLGFNFRMPEVTGAIGLCQLKRLKQAIERRRAIAERYREGLHDLDSFVLPWERPTDPHCYQLFTVRLRKQAWKCSRDEFLKRLLEAGVQARLYFPCLHRQPVFQELGDFRDSDLPNSVEFAQTAFSLPMFPTLTDDEVTRVVEAMRLLAKNLRR